MASLILDWISFIEPYAPFGITPWNPDTGLSFVLVLLFGRQMIPFLFISPLLSQIVQHQPPLPLAIELSHAALIGGGYTGASLFLQLPSLRFDPALSSMRDTILFLLVAVVSTFLVASSYVAVTIAGGLLPVHDFGAATLRYWVGDLIGIIIVAPFVLITLARRRLPVLSIETSLQFAAAIAALALVFGYAKEQQYQLFYVLFLPIIWMAVRGGTEGVVVGTLFIQIGVILGVTLFPEKHHDVTAFQTLMLVLATTGLIVGELVTERRRTQTQLHLHQRSLARLTQLGSMGEFAAAIAHELNQPLMAAGTYTRVVSDTLRSPNPDTAAAAEVAQKAVTQVERAAEVVRRLRALVRLDRSNRSASSVDNLIRETLHLCQPDLDRVHVGTQISVPGDLPPVMVDTLQIQQTLLNILRNSIEAIHETGQNGHISIEAALAGEDFVEIAVRDSGPGFPADFLENPFLPFSSTKAEGIGFGLPLCKSIVEAHGGKLWLGLNAQGGGAVHFTLPAVKGLHYG